MKIDPEKLEFTQADYAEVAMIVDWAGREAWNPGLNDAACFYAADTSGFYLAKYQGHAIASLSVVAYGNQFAFLGLYITRPDYRQQACGYALWRHVMQARDFPLIGLDGVLAQQANYQKSGFQFAHRNIRFQGKQAAATKSGGWQLVDANAVDFQLVAAFDQRHFLFERQAFLAAWIKQAGAKSLCLLDHQQIKGFAVRRPCRQGYKIGPLFAESQQHALALIQALVDDIAEDSLLIIDVPEPNQAALALMQQLGWQASFETARMYKGALPDLPLQHIFGITSFELG